MLYILSMFCSTCLSGYIGNPQVSCSLIPPTTPSPRPDIKVDPCSVTDCGPYSTCTSNGVYATCRCLPNYIGSPPQCRPECTIDQDCPSNLACIREKCRDPCQNSCGTNAECRTINHRANCRCKTQRNLENCLFFPSSIY